MKRFFFGILIVAVLIAIVLYLMGYWSANVEQGQLPKVDVSAEGGRLPKVDVNSNIVVGTKEATVGAPGIGIEKSKIDVPVIGVSETPPDANQQQPRPAQ